MSTQVRNTNAARRRSLIARCEASKKYKRATCPVGRLHWLLCALDDRASPAYNVGVLGPAMASWTDDGVKRTITTPVALPSVNAAAECLLWQIEEMLP